MAKMTGSQTAEAARFLVEIKKLLENPVSLLLQGASVPIDD